MDYQKSSKPTITDRNMSRDSRHKGKKSKLAKSSRNVGSPGGSNPSTINYTQNIRMSKQS